MQTPKEEPSTYRPSPSLILELTRFFWRYRTHPEALEPFLTSLTTKGVPAANVSNLQTFVIGWRQVYLQRLEVLYRIDSYLLTGIGAIDVVLLPVVLPMGVPDRALFIATLSLALSLVLVSTSFFVGFVKRDQGITSYGKMHSALISLALTSGVIALTATFWHVSTLIGVVFFVLVVLAYVVCAAYLALAMQIVRFLQNL